MSGGEITRPGRRVVDPSHRSRAGPGAVHGVPGGQRQRRPSPLSGPAGRSGSGPARAATQTHQAGPLPPPAPGHRGQARGRTGHPSRSLWWLADAHPHDRGMQVSHETMIRAAIRRVGRTRPSPPPGRAVAGWPPFRSGGFGDAPRRPGRVHSRPGEGSSSFCPHLGRRLRFSTHDPSPSAKRTGSRARRPIRRGSLD